MFGSAPISSFRELTKNIVVEKLRFKKGDQWMLPLSIVNTSHKVHNDPGTF